MSIITIKYPTDEGDSFEDIDVEGIDTIGDLLALFCGNHNFSPDEFYLETNQALEEDNYVEDYIGETLKLHKRYNPA